MTSEHIYMMRAIAQSDPKQPAKLGMVCDLAEAIDRLTALVESMAKQQSMILEVIEVMTARLDRREQ